MIMEDRTLQKVANKKTSCLSDTLAQIGVLAQISLCLLPFFLKIGIGLIWIACLIVQWTCVRCCRNRTRRLCSSLVLVSVKWSVVLVHMQYLLFKTHTMWHHRHLWMSRVQLLIGTVRIWLPHARKIFAQDVNIWLNNLDVLESVRDAPYLHAHTSELVEHVNVIIKHKHTFRVHGRKLRPYITNVLKYSTHLGEHADILLTHLSELAPYLPELVEKLPQLAKSEHIHAVLRCTPQLVQYISTLMRHFDILLVCADTILPQSAKLAPHAANIIAALDMLAPHLLQLSPHLSVLFNHVEFLFHEDVLEIWRSSQKIAIWASSINTWINALPMIAATEHRAILPLLWPVAEASHLSNCITFNNIRSVHITCLCAYANELFEALPAILQHAPLLRENIDFFCNYLPVILKKWHLIYPLLEDGHIASHSELSSYLQLPEKVSQYSNILKPLSRLIPMYLQRPHIKCTTAFMIEHLRQFKFSFVL